MFLTEILMEGLSETNSPLFLCVINQNSNKSGMTLKFTRLIETYILSLKKTKTISMDEQEESGKTYLHSKAF